jgi:hypothetical protein
MRKGKTDFGVLLNMNSCQISVMYVANWVMSRNHVMRATGD